MLCAAFNNFLQVICSFSRQTVAVKATNLIMKKKWKWTARPHANMIEIRTGNRKFIWSGQKSGHATAQRVIYHNRIYNSPTKIVDIRGALGLYCRLALLRHYKGNSLKREKQQLIYT